jgi:hypothetical protein
VELPGSLTVGGGLAITWHGDRTRGCADAGLCGYRGSLGMHSGGDGQYFLTVSNGRLYDDFSYFELATPPVVRVQRAEPGGEGGACTDVITRTEVSMIALPAGRGHARVGIGGDALSAARCAGPPLSAALARLPRPRVALSRLTSAHMTVDLSGRRRYVAGRFSGTVSSTLQLHLGRATRGSVRPTVDVPSPHPRGRLVRVVNVHALYSVTGFVGKLSTTFGGFADPPCAELDVCGVTGSANWAILSRGGLVVVDAEARARRSDRGFRGALAAIGRGQGYADAYGDLRRSLGTTTADLARPDGVACHDATRIASPGLGASFHGRRLTLLLGGEAAFDPTGGDLLRAGCPGPTQADAIGIRSVASGSIPFSALARRRLAVALTGAGQFRAPGYAGSRNARFTLGLQRLSARAVYSRVRVGR